jgi:hypothetical protein
MTMTTSFAGTVVIYDLETTNFVRGQTSLTCVLAEGSSPSKFQLTDITAGEDVVFRKTTARHPGPCRRFATTQRPGFD